VADELASDELVGARPAAAGTAMSNVQPAPTEEPTEHVDADGPRATPFPGPTPVPPATVRQRLARLAPRGSAANPVLEPLVRTLRTNHPKADLRLVERAYDVAEERHRGQLRKSGEPYITHPLAVAQILAELGMPAPVLAAALLHDTLEDTDYTIEELSADFGEEVAALVDGVTKLDHVKYGEASQAQTVRKMVIAMARDIRVLLIKLCDRLHNMRTMRFLPPDKQQRKARETLEIYTPLAHRLGMNTIKWELEDLAFAILYPKMYDEIVRLVAELAPSRDEYLAGVIESLQSDLRAAKIKATVTGRPKHYYSIYQKMIVRGRDFADIYDLVGIRILVDTVRDCYAVLGTVHAKWHPVQGRFKDFIAMPKFNLYQSLHTTVIGPGGNAVELQIRTREQHQIAENGIAAHWMYKDGGGGSAKRRLAEVSEMAWLRQLVEWQRETADPGEFLEDLRYEIGTQQVYVFTPKGDVHVLPLGATPVDFAYSVHTEVGHRCVGARVNGKLVPLESELTSGDSVQVLTSKSVDAGPSRDWLTFVKSGRARSKIKAWFSKERREEAIERGKDALARQLRKKDLPMQRLLAGEAPQAIAHDLRYSDISALYAALGEGHVSAQSVVQRLVALHGGQDGAAEDLEEATTPIPARRRATVGDPGVAVKDASDIWVKLAKCCTPVPGDAIVGFVTRGDGVSVHRANCSNINALAVSQRDRLVEVEWSPSASSVFLVQIHVEALDRARLLADVTRALSDQHVNILSASVTTGRDRIAQSRFSFEMGDPKHLGSVLAAVRGVEGVYDVYRVVG
jgi:GTP diphosphokinase / guanosine-3',5'-bis(diphosphate) 3'-diphosphatase